MYTLVEIGGKQYKVEKGSKIKIDKVDKEKGDVLEYRSVLLVSDQENVRVGKPYVEGVSVKAVVEDHGREKKIIICKFKRRRNYKRIRGHRQPYSLIRIEDITGIG